MKYLISNKSLSNEQVIQQAEKVGVTMIPGGHQYISFLRDNMKFPINYDPKNQHHAPSVDFLYREGIYETWYPTSSTLDAIKLASAPEARESVITLLSTPMQLDKIVTSLVDLFCIETTVRTLQELRHYFWNTDLVSKGEMNFLLKEYKAGSILHTAANLYQDKLGPMTLLWKLGRLPAKLAREDVIRSIRDIAFFNALEVDRTIAQGEKKAAAFKAYCDTTLRTQVMLDEVETQDEQVLDEFYKHIKIGRAEFNPPTAEKLGIKPDETPALVPEDEDQDSN